MRSCIVARALAWGGTRDDRRGLRGAASGQARHHHQHPPRPASSPPPRPPEKGLKPGALGLISSVVVGVASTAPAYSLAATLGFVVAVIGLQAPIVTIIAFIPMLFIAYAYKELNSKDPDCGTTFTWGARAFGPKTGWMGGWGIVAADVLVMASLAQIAGQYVFLLFNANGIGSDASSGWVLLVGVAWIVVMTLICYVGIEVSANFQKILLGDRAHDARAPVGLGAREGRERHRARRAPTPISWSWFNPFAISSPSAFINGVLLMLFIYWGWDTTVSVNEETANPHTVPGPRRRALDARPAGDVRPRRPVDADLRRHRDDGHRARATRTTRATCSRSSGTRSSGRRRSATCSPTCCC